MKKLLGLIVFVAVGFVGFSQQDYQFNHFFFDKVSFNPGAVGMEENCLGVFFRNQWSGLSGNPSTTMINYHQPVKEVRGGLGLTAFSDNLGNRRTQLGEIVEGSGSNLTNTSIRLAYSYHHTLGNGAKLGAGLNVGYQSIRLGNNWYAIDGVVDDDAINSNEESKGAADFTLGVYYKATNFWAGLSSTHLSAPDLTGTNFNFNVARHYYFMTGYETPVGSSGNVMLYPSLLVKSDLVENSLDVNVRAEFNNLLYAGVTYRTSDAVVPMVGFTYGLPGTTSFSHSLRLGYSYDVTLNELSNFSNGSHEVHLGYCWKFIKPIIKKSHGNPRWL